MQITQKGLIESAQLGDVQAFEQLIRPTEKKMLSLALGLTKNPDDAEDIYQDAMLNAFKAIPKFRLESQFTTWLYRIVVNTACNSRRKLKSKLNQLFVNEKDDFEIGINQIDSGVNSAVTNPEQELVNQQLSEAIGRAIDCLSEQERIAFVVCHQHEIKLNDAAKIMDCSVGNVKSTLFRARQKMRSQLEDYLR